jgi:predicted permease
MSDFLLDLRYALRALRANPAFTTVAVLTLALSLGATTAIYTVVDRVLLRSLPYPESDRLARIWHRNARSVVPREGMAYETYQELDAAIGAIDLTAGISPHWDFTVSAPEPERVSGYWVSASFFSLTGATASIGRVFGPAEDAPGGESVVVLSHEYWRARFGGDSSVVGRVLTIGGASATVIGVLRPNFRFGEPVELWAPLGQNPLVPRGRQVRWVDVVARLTPGATVEQARSQVAASMERLAQAYPAQAGGLGGDVAGLYDATVGDVRPALWTLLGGVAFVLLIACANIGNLLLTRATARQTEVAVRSALGAGTARLLRQFLTESLTLAALGGVLGLGLAAWLLDLFRALGPADLPRLHEVGLDGRVLAVSALVTLGAGALFGLAPLGAVRSNLHVWLKAGGRSLAGSGGRLRDALVVAEVALALVLLAGAGLLIRSFSRLMDVDPGFRAQGVLTLQIAVPGTYDPAARIQLYERLYADLDAIPGVEAAGLATRLPLGSQLSTKLDLRDHPVPDGEQPEVEFRRAGGRYFDAMGIPILRGRPFDRRDTPATTGAMILSRSLAARLWPGEDPIGRQVRFWFAGITPDAPWLEVVGIAGDVKHFGLDAEAPDIVYVAASQGGPPASPLLAIRTAGDPQALVSAVRERIRAIDPAIVQYDVRTMASRVGESVAGRRFNMLLLGLFGGLALTLAAVGIYGVIGYAVRRRTPELGIRMALGAARGDVLRLVVGGGMRLAATGLALGLVGSLLLTRLIRGLLFEVSPNDPVALVVVTLSLGAVAFVATYLPALRATRIAPTDALRHE